MRYFTISINGVPSIEVANKFWVEISRFDVNFMTLDRNSYIYGYADDGTINILYEKSKKLGFSVILE